MLLTDKNMLADGILLMGFMWADEGILTLPISMSSSCTVGARKQALMTKSLLSEEGISVCRCHLSKMLAGEVLNELHLVGSNGCHVIIAANGTVTYGTCRILRWTILIGVA